MNVTTLRNGHPTTALNVSEDTVQRLAAAFRAGVLIRLTYVDLKCVQVQRDCYVEQLNMDLGFAIIKHRDFGHRTVFFERTSAPGIPA